MIHPRDHGTMWILRPYSERHVPPYQVPSGDPLLIRATSDQLHLKGNTVKSAN